VIRAIHHVGIVVRDLDISLGFYRDALGLPLGERRVVAEQGVEAALLGLGDCEVELLEPVAADTGIARFLERRGEGLHHVCFETDGIETELAGLKSKGAELIDQEPRQGLAGTIAFVHPKALHGCLAELVDAATASRPHGSQAGHARRLDHVALAVTDVQEAARTWEQTLGLRVESFFEPGGQRLRVAKMPVGNAFLALATPLDGDGLLARFIAERGPGMYSVAIEVDDVDAAVHDLRERDIRVAGPEHGAWIGSRIARIDPASAAGVDLHLIGA